MNKKPTKSVKAPQSKEKGFVYFQQADGTSKYLPFDDARVEVVLKCTQADIKEAVCGDPMNCVMARMFRRAFGKTCTEVRVGKRYMHVVFGEGAIAHSKRYGLKGKVMKAIHQFDISKGGSGFVSGETYILTPPSPTSVRGGRVKGAFGAHNGKGARNRLIENRAPIRPTRNIMCFTAPNAD